MTLGVMTSRYEGACLMQVLWFIANTAQYGSTLGCKQITGTKMGCFARCKVGNVQLSCTRV